MRNQETAPRLTVAFASAEEVGQPDEASRKRRDFAAGQLAAMRALHALTGSGEAVIEPESNGQLIAKVRGQPVPKDRILAIGDGLKTDIKGARDAGLRSVFIASALHVPHGRTFDDALLSELFADDPHPPVAAQVALAW